MSDDWDFGLSEDEEEPGVRRRRAAGRFLIFLASLAVVVVVVGGAGLLVTRALHGLGTHPDYAGTGDGSRVIFHIPQGAGGKRVASLLAQQNVVASSAAFRDAFDAAGSPTLTPGYFRMQHHMSGKAALDDLLSKDARIEVSVVIPEGYTVAQIYAKIDQITAGVTDIPHVTAGELQQAAASPAGLGLPDYAHGKVEGLLFPATYPVDPGADAAGLLNQMVARYDQEASMLKLEQQAQALGHPPYDVVIAASIVQAEGGGASSTTGDQSNDYPKIAAVIYNRLAQGMPLQMDSTVNYALGEHKAHLSNADLQVDSPYNTYQHAGLPPTPIDSPGELALQAALHPASGSWLYFITNNSGVNEFFTDKAAFAKRKAEIQAAQASASATASASAPASASAAAGSGG